jgi:hypothetical protein
MLLHATIPLHPLASTVTTGLFVPFPCLFWHAKHVFQQGKFCMGEIWSEPILPDTEESQLPVKGR